VPFGQLLERGLLHPGQKLYFGRDGRQTAVVLANGKLKYRDQIGSIHQIGKAIQNGPCNGWEHWYYINPQTKQRDVIDQLRELVLAEHPSGVAQSA
jgi:modification methylase